MLVNCSDAERSDLVGGGGIALKHLDLIIGVGGSFDVSKGLGSAEITFALWQVVQPANVRPVGSLDVELAGHLVA